MNKKNSNSALLIILLSYLLWTPAQAAKPL